MSHSCCSVSTYFAVSTLLKIVGFWASKLVKTTRKTSKSHDFEVFGGDKRDRTAEALNAMAHVIQNAIDNPQINLKNKKYWKYCTQLLD